MGSQVLLSCVLLGLSYLVQSQQQTSSSPVRVAPSVTKPNDLTTCPPLNFSTHRETVQQSVEDYYRVLPCSCGGARGWTRAAHLNMSDTSQQCPSAWTPINTPVRGCSRTNGGRACDSVTYPVYGLTYSRVCGRISAYRRGHTSAFYNSISLSLNTIEDAYLSGVSLTHGLPGSRQHIWSFVAGLSHSTPGNTEICPCSTTSFTHQLPSFLNNNYFCETGEYGGYESNYFYTNDPLWDGQGCWPGSTCCEFNSPPWFCTSLPQPTNDDLEIRSCYEGGTVNENIIIDLIDIYVK